MSEQPLPVDFEAVKTQLLHIFNSSKRALKELEEAYAVKCRKWKCTSCGYTKFLSRVADAKTAEVCPKCGGKPFDPVLAD